MISFAGGFALVLLFSSGGALAQEPNTSQMLQVPELGKTLGVEITEQHPLPEQTILNDSGINVLIDHAHQSIFDAMWRLPPELRKRGLRVCGSQASLSSVLQEGKLSRIRIRVDDRRPFAWWPNARFNVVITYQLGPASQPYLREEMLALKQFVSSGGGLIVVGGKAQAHDDIAAWSLNELISHFGASLSPVADYRDETKLLTLSVQSPWEVQDRGERGHPVVARRTYGKGRIVVISPASLFFWNRRVPDSAPNSKRARSDMIGELAKWASEGSGPAGGTRRLPQEASGGGPIYPELGKRVGNVVVYYAKNQKKGLIQTVSRDMPRVQKQLEAWLPSPPSGGPLYLIAAAGGGGGWAVNAYKPNEVGTIKLTSEGLLSVFAHELAHTMAGPPNSRGGYAANWPMGNTSEAHAGWFQGKINAQITAQTDRPNKNANAILDVETAVTELDLAIGEEAIWSEWGKGASWKKIWWVWQKLDDRYGPTWYPRWRWVQQTRWQDDPERQLTWEETVEDMSIAVGEDLFPFFRRIGTSLGKERLDQIAFGGQTIALPVAPLGTGPAGRVRLEPAGDYRKPLCRPRD